MLLARSDVGGAGGVAHPRAARAHWVCGLDTHNPDARSRAEVYYYASIGSRPCALDNEDVAKIMDFIDPATPHGFNDETGEFEVVAADDDDDAL